jgi:hypothetical protein
VDVTAARALAAISIFLLALRLYAASRVGFGDAEALYATYALHPQPLYLDHPGLVGSVARLIGRGGAPSPLATHLVTALWATAVPYAAVLAARLCGAARGRASLAGLAIVAVPELAVGLFALTPDLLLAPLWLLAVGLTAAALRSPPGGAASILCHVGAGAAAGLAIDSKATGAVLLLGLGASMLRRPARHPLRSPGPYLGLAMALLLSAPVVGTELAAGFPMLRHRLIDTQAGAGISLRNIGALLGGQIAYVSPLILLAGLIVARDLFRGSGASAPAGSGATEPAPSDEHERARAAVAALLRTTTLVAAIPLAALCLWSRVAEPHWFAPALLALPLQLALAPERTVPPRLARWAVASGLFASVVVHAWALTDVAPRVMGEQYEARYDLANDLFAWPATLPAIRVLIAQTELRFGEQPVVLTPHWTVAAQLQAGLGVDTQVSTSPSSHDDFVRWTPPDRWQDAPVVLWVSDDRFGLEPPPWLASRQTAGSITLPVRRGNRVVRSVRVMLLVLADEA